MKRLLKTLLIATLATMMLSGIMSVSAAETDKTQVKICVVGNSILGHGPSEDLGWYGNWGMAASSAENDYFRTLQRQLSEKYPNIDFQYASVSGVTIERAIEESETKDYSSVIESVMGEKLKTFKPDIVILQIGENSSGSLTGNAIKNAFVDIADYCEKIVPDVKLVYCTPILGGKEKANGIRAAAEETGHALIELIKYNSAEYKATGLFENAAVANHPGDKGMLAMATEMADACSVIIDKKLNPSEVAVRVDGVYVKFDVKPMIIEGRTMVPLRAIFEALGATVEWDDATKTVTSNLNGVEVSLTIGQPVLRKDGAEKALDVPAQIVDSRTLVPVRAISEAFDCKVEWVDATRTVLVKKPAELSNGITNADAEAAGVNNFTSPNAVITRVEDTSIPGNHAWLVTGPKEKAWVYIEHDYILEEGKKYKLTCDVKAVSDSDGYPTQIGFYSNVQYYEEGALHGKDHIVGAITIPGDGSWTHFESNFVVGKMTKTDLQKISFYANPPSDTTSAIYMIDNIQVEVIG